MKTKEEIEQLASEHILSENGQIGFVLGYTQCKQDMSKLSEWQLCPKCFGEGQVSNVGTSSSTYRTCLVCNGNRILIKPYINKQD